VIDRLKRSTIPVVVLIVSDIFTKEMLFNLRCVERLGGILIWVKLRPNKYRNSEIEMKPESTSLVTFWYPKSYQESLKVPKPPSSVNE